MELKTIRRQLDSQGFAWIRSAVSPQECMELKAELAQLGIPVGRGGVRHIEKKSGKLAAFAKNGVVATMAAQLLSDEARLVRGIWFDKIPEQNWLVSWHQDITVTAQSRFDEPGWDIWSEKDGVLHVQPPLDVLQSMVTFRLHLDPATSRNGCLKVLPRSHLQGIHRDAFSVDEGQIEYCEAAVGDLLLMSPLLWHSSSKSLASEGRQILHFEYGAHLKSEQLGWQLLELNQ
ncbi:phytanoyl-CoA dioxygenase family protein [Chitinibacter sp. S2-10]|uniref:phytanoyl-CoA dioxygenase family protein n=1 Tax=Chitinibacter sp. S2-10 TaxID=3373597 RepID=UPI003977E02D